MHSSPHLPQALSSVQTEDVQKVGANAVRRKSTPGKPHAVGVLGLIQENPWPSRP